ncbi:MAG TPA: FHA domain-containing protein [Gemmatimonadales bacterium]|nr:FHA domain-containing protein [Gemmatimonadales bacterium]
MMELELSGQRFAVPAGETVVGSAPDAGIRLTGAGVAPRHLVVRGLPDGTVAVGRGAPDAEALVNGIRLGDDPTVLLHGDKLQVGAHELVAVDAERAGSTRTIDASKLAAITPLPRAGAARVVGTTNGRLVCLTDGREYQVGEGLVFGRDAGSDVVVTGGDVSRQHAELRPGPEGYVLADLSANGTLVNDERIEGPRVLARGDVIGIGADEFRFYADAPAEPLVPPPGAEQRLNDTLMGIPVSEVRAMAATGGAGGAGGTPAPAAQPAPAPLASFLVRSGALKGERLAVRAPVVNIGRADYNDIVLPEPSVSASHARLQRRDGIWTVADLGSTNGTTVDGEPVEDEPYPLGPGATIRFGEVGVLFEPFDVAEPVRAGPPARAAGGAGAGPGETGAERPPVVERIRPPRIVPPEPEGRGTRWLLAGLVVVAAVVVAYLLLNA